MTKIMYVSLDDRACNYEFTGYLAALTDDLELLRPPYEIMGTVWACTDLTHAMGTM